MKKELIYLKGQDIPLMGVMKEDEVEECGSVDVKSMRK